MLPMLLLQAGLLTLPEPQVPPPIAVAERGAGPTYYRLSPTSTESVYRIGLGNSIRLPTDGVQAKPAFALDVVGGASILFERGGSFGALFETGYSYVGFGEHYFTLGPGLWARRLTADDGTPGGETDPTPNALVFAFVPRLLAGASHGDLALGFRTGLLVSYNALGVELAHQFVRVSGFDVHSLHFTFVAGAFGGML